MRYLWISLGIAALGLGWRLMPAPSSVPAPAPAMPEPAPAAPPAASITNADPLAPSADDKRHATIDDLVRGK